MCWVVCVGEAAAGRVARPYAELVVAGVALRLRAVAACVCRRLVHKAGHVPDRGLAGVGRGRGRAGHVKRARALETLRYGERHFPPPLQLKARDFGRLAALESVICSLEAACVTCGVAATHSTSHHT